MAERFAAGLREALEEVAAWKRGEVALETTEVAPRAVRMPPERVRAIRKSVARSTREFERRFGVPAATMSNWEQGRRRPDPAARVLLQVIERDPAAVEAALRPERR